jgi:hypothetical protein
LKRHNATWIRKANNILNDPLIQKEPSLQHTIASVSPSRRLNNEAEVRDASSNFLYDPVQKIIDIKFGNGVLSNLETPSDGNKVRYDRIWTVKGTTERIAVMEYKKRGYLNLDDFEDAIVEDLADQARIDRLLSENHSRLQGNALMLMKQASAYSITSKTNYVVLFDWKAMMLLDFNDRDKFEEGTIGPKAFFSWYEEDGKILEQEDDLQGNKQNPIYPTFRKALLGWLAIACRVKFGVNNPFGIEEP